MRALITVVILLTAGMAWAFSWEGELDPNEFDKWKLLSALPSPQGFLWMFVKNPDQASAIDIVAMAVDLDAALLGYRYFKHGIPYSYVFDVKEDKYVRRNLTDEQRQSCMKCHRDQLVPQASV
jgi:hypothetical protein